MINVSDRLTAKTVENILTDAKEVAWQRGDENVSTSGTVATALNNISNEIIDLNGKVATLASGVAMNISVSPSTIYKANQTPVTVSATMSNAPSSFILEIYSGSSNTAIATGDTTPTSISITVNTTSNSIAYTVKGKANGMDLTPKSASLSARYPIYYGFGTEASGITVTYSPTTSAAHTYNATAASTGSFFILVPPDISALKQDGFTEGGAPFVMKPMYTTTINGISNYKVYQSGVDDYPAGTKLDVVAVNA